MKPPFSKFNLVSDIDYCVPYPCENGGTCIDGITGYTCKCKLGTVGQNCQIGNEITKSLAIKT